MRKTFLAITILTVSVALAPACASKGFVRDEVGGVNAKVDTLSTTLSSTIEETQQRVGENETRISAVDQRAEAAGQAAADARNVADGAAAAADDLDVRVEVLDQTTRKLVYEVILSEDQGNFSSGGTELPDAAKARVDAVIAQIAANPQNIFFEVEGHTDSTGPAELNKRLGLARAEAVKTYLYEEHQVPLHKMNVISYGEEQPAAPNNTSEGRAQNRRVVLRVLS